MRSVIIIKEATSTRNYVFLFVFKISNAFLQAIECSDSTVPVCQMVQLSGKISYNFFVYGMYFPNNLSLRPYIETGNSMESDIYFTELLYEKGRDRSTERTDPSDVSDVGSEGARFASSIHTYVRIQAHT